MMGQQETMTVEAMTEAGGALRRKIVALTLALVMAAMMVALTASPAFAGNAFAKGQNNSNPGFYRDFHGDTQNNECNRNGSNCASPPSNSPHGLGTGNN